MAGLPSSEHCNAERGELRPPAAATSRRPGPTRRPKIVIIASLAAGSNFGEEMDGSMLSLLPSRWQLTQLPAVVGFYNQFWYHSVVHRKSLRSLFVNFIRTMGLFQWLPLANGGRRREHFALSLWRRASPETLPPSPAVYRR